MGKNGIVIAGQLCLVILEGAGVEHTPAFEGDAAGKDEGGLHLRNLVGRKGGGWGGVTVLLNQLLTYVTHTPSVYY